MNEENKQLGANLEKEIQHTPNEIMQQMIDALIIAVHSQLMSGDTAATVIEITRELLHWAYMKPGSHQTPAEMIIETLAATSVVKTTADEKGKLKLDA